jgi:hypothetical protein
MDYHWATISADQVVLLEAGVTLGGGKPSLPMMGVAAVIDKMGPYLGTAKEIYQASGPLMPEVRDYDSLQEAKRGVEAVVRAAGGSIDGRFLPPSTI